MHEIVSITEESIRGFGHILHHCIKTPTFDNKEFTFTSDVFVFSAQLEMSVGILTAYRREIKIDCLEAHDETEEMLFQLENDAVIFLAQANSPEDIHGFFFKQGEAIVLNPGTWHWVPFPDRDAQCKTIVIFKKGTGENDSKFFNPKI